MKRVEAGGNSLPAAGLEALVGAVAVGVVLVGTLAVDVVIVVQVLGVLLRLVVGLDLVGLVEALGLGESVDLRADNTGEDLLSGGVADSLACDSC